MEVSIGSRIKHAWNAFLNRDPTGFYRDIGVGYSYRPDQEEMKDLSLPLYIIESHWIALQLTFNMSVWTTPKDFLKKFLRG